MQVTNLNGAIKQITVGGVNYSLTGSSYMGTTAEWNNSSYKPAHGELIIYNDNGKIQFKIGDGTTLAKNLAFVEMGSDALLEQIEAISDLVGDTPVADQINAAINAKIYIQNEAPPENVPVGTIWIDTSTTAIIQDEGVEF